MEQDQIDSSNQPSGRLSAQKRALGVWIRAWQLAGNQWPPPSRAIAHQIVRMLARQVEDISHGRLSKEEAFEMAREAMIPIMAQRFYSGSEQDVVIELLERLLLDAEIGDL